MKARYGDISPKKLADAKKAPSDMVVVEGITFVLNEIESLKATIEELEKQIGRVTSKPTDPVVKPSPVDYEFEIIRRDPWAEFSPIVRVVATAKPRRIN